MDVWSRYLSSHCFQAQHALLPHTEQMVTLCRNLSSHSWILLYVALTRNKAAAGPLVLSRRRLSNNTTNEVQAHGGPRRRWDGGWRVAAVCQWCREVHSLSAMTSLYREPTTTHIHTEPCWWSVPGTQLGQGLMEWCSTVYRTSWTKSPFLSFRMLQRVGMDMHLDEDTEAKTSICWIITTELKFGFESCSTPSLASGHFSRFDPRRRRGCDPRTKVMCWAF